MPYRKYPVQKVYRTCVRVHALKQFFGPLGNRTDSLTRAWPQTRTHKSNVIETKYESRSADRARLNSAGQPIFHRDTCAIFPFFAVIFSVLQVYTLCVCHCSGCAYVWCTSKHSPAFKLSQIQAETHAVMHFNESRGPFAPKTTTIIKPL